MGAESSQMIAASTQSPDGTTKSSMSFSSSSSSSSTMTSSSGGPGGAGPMMSLGMGDMGKGMGGMPAMGMDMGMDDMMKKMMGDMKLGGPSRGSSLMQSGGMSSMGGMPSLPGMPDMGGMIMGKGLDIEELSTAGTDVTGPPAYTVTSPRPSVASPPT